MRRFLVKTPGQFFTRLFVLALGIVWIKVERPDVDYSEYLGHNTKSYEGETEIVVNHTSWVDILNLMWWSMPSFVSSEEVKDFPFIGKICDSL